MTITLGGLILLHVLPPSVQEMSPSPTANQRVCLTHYTRSKWSREGSFKPRQVLQIPFSGQAAPRTANRARSSPALAV